MNYDINDVYVIILYATGKNKSNGYVSPSDFNTIINIAQKSWSAYLLGSLQSYMPGRPIPTVGFGENSVVRQRLSPTIYGYNLHVDSSGFSPYPGDYLNTDTMWSIYGLNRIRYAAQEKLWSIYGSVIDPISTNPIYLIEDLGFRFYPQSIGMAKLSYVRNPPNAVWGYVDDANGRPVYSAARSTQLVWDSDSILQIIVRALALVGVNLQLNVVSQYAEMIKKGGQ